MMRFARKGWVVVVLCLGMAGAGCPNGPGPGPGEPDSGTNPPDKKVHPQAARTLSCGGMDLRIPDLDASMTLAWASFLVAQQNQAAFAPLGGEARRTMFDTCILPAIVGEK
ncbi:hypothetical protein [Vitiosangium sp. GDMCC 1.1324]|uniref:hypothetical protein n=1 Tax=Vitiosangium sp. (strain GDMCC 1.1324) TaxID=2138576 RepID=UPI000D3D755D|nr:hypothetical protein [Vitiosangium sp. GDMCC 1.1324]PTL75657.1 hypothetical protein DAT35_53525 [Vitiosangium sp. GDMCC 1.1324]